jgi:hypothetical protein
MSWNEETENDENVYGMCAFFGVIMCPGTTPKFPISCLGRGESSKLRKSATWHARRRMKNSYDARFYHWYSVRTVK